MDPWDGAPLRIGPNGLEQPQSAAERDHYASLDREREEADEERQERERAEAQAIRDAEERYEAANPPTGFVGFPGLRG